MTAVTDIKPCGGLYGEFTQVFGLYLTGPIDLALDVLERNHGLQFPLTVTLPCGTSRAYATRADLPVTDQCVCGTVPYEHWFVQHGDFWAPAGAGASFTALAGQGAP